MTWSETKPNNCLDVCYRIILTRTVLQQFCQAQMACHMVNSFHMNFLHFSKEFLSTKRFEDEHTHLEDQHCIWLSDADHCVSSHPVHKHTTAKRALKATCTQRKKQEQKKVKGMKKKTKKIKIEYQKTCSLGTLVNIICGGTLYLCTDHPWQRGQACQHSS